MFLEIFELFKTFFFFLIVKRNYCSYFINFCHLVTDNSQWSVDVGALCSGKKFSERLCDTYSPIHHTDMIWLRFGNFWPQANIKRSSPVYVCPPLQWLRTLIGRIKVELPCRRSNKLIYILHCPPDLHCTFSVGGIHE